ncbi:MAG TPA: hypothetical protein VMU34_13485 [Mycobacterium sp.]|nr:hypothetical protein [Mycobacterium sp.]
MTLTVEEPPIGPAFVIEHVCTGAHVSGFGQLADGRSFAFYRERRMLMVEIYRPELCGPVPQAEDVVAVATHPLTDIDLCDERSIAATVRDAIAAARPVPRTRSTLAADPAHPAP